MPLLLQRAAQKPGRHHRCQVSRSASTATSRVDSFPCQLPPRTLRPGGTSRKATDRPRESPGSWFKLLTSAHQKRGESKTSREAQSGIQHGILGGVREQKNRHWVKTINHRR